MSYDADKHSKDRLGSAGQVPAVPMMPIAAQVSQATGMVHYRLMGDAYVRGGLPSIHPAAFAGVIAAIKACPVEPSYSGSPSPYYRIQVAPVDGGQYAILTAIPVDGDPVTIGRVAVFDAAEIVSAEDIGDAVTQSKAGLQSPPQAPQDPPAGPAEGPTP